MKSPSSGERARVAVVSLLLLLAAAFPALGAPAGLLTELARAEAAEGTAESRGEASIEAYLALDLPVEASLSLGRRLREGSIPKERATPLFERILRRAEGRESPRAVASIAGIALGDGIRSPQILLAAGKSRLEAGDRGGGLSALESVREGTSWFPAAQACIARDSVARGDLAGAAAAFGRACEAWRKIPGGESAAAEAALARGEALLLEGRYREAAVAFGESFALGGPAMSRVGLAVARGEPLPRTKALESWAGSLPPGRKARLLLLESARASARGDHDSAFGLLARAEEAVGDAEREPSGIEAEDPVAPAFDAPGKEVAAAAEAARIRIAEAFAGGRPDAAARDGVELLVAMEMIDPDGRPAAGMDLRNALLERFVLGGPTLAERLAALARRVETLENLPHPIGRYRALAAVRKRLAGLEALAGRIREAESAALPESGAASRFDGLLRAGRKILLLEEARRVAEDAGGRLRASFDIFGRRDEGDSRWKEALEEGLRSAASLPISPAKPPVRRVVRRDPPRGLREAVAVREAEALLALARAGSAPEAKGAGAGWIAAATAAATRVASRTVPDPDRSRIAVGIARLLLDGPGRGAWSRQAGEGEEGRLAGTILPILDSAAAEGTFGEEASYLAAVLELALGRAGRETRAAAFVASRKGSPRACDVAVRLAGEWIASGRAGEAWTALAVAGCPGRGEADLHARYLRAAILLGKGDPRGAMEELGTVLREPSVADGELGELSREAVKLAARAARSIPCDRLERYLPIREGAEGGRRLLARLLSEEEGGGDPVREDRLRAIYLWRYPAGPEVPTVEAMGAEAALRNGEEGRAVAEAIRVLRAYGPGSGRWETATPAGRESFRLASTRLLEELAERRAAAGARSGDRNAWADAATLLGGRIGLGRPDEEGVESLRFRRAVATIRSGEREKGMAMLEELYRERDEGPTGERVAKGIVDVSLEGFAQGWRKGAGLAADVRRLAGRHPSGDAGETALRAVSALAEKGDAGEAESLSDAISANGKLPDPFRAKAFLGSASMAREREAWGDVRLRAEAAHRLLPPGERKLRERARDLYLLASAKEADAAEGRRDRAASASILEGAAARFPDSDEAAEMLFRSAVLSVEIDDDPGAARRFGRYRNSPRADGWKEALATLFLALRPSGGPVEGEALRDIERSLRSLDGGIRKGVPSSLFPLVARGRIAVGASRAAAYRDCILRLPLERTIDRKVRLFREALGPFLRAEREAGGPDGAEAARQAGELYADMGRCILESPRPRGMRPEESQAYESALKEQAGRFLAQARSAYTRALERIRPGVGDPGAASLAGSRIEDALTRLARIQEGRK